jgi:Uma2 family endonuclease
MNPHSQPSRPLVRRTVEQESIPPLEPGDNLDQKTFHERYETMPPGVQAELIGGVVHMPSPRKPRHGRMSGRLIGWLGMYEGETPGIELYIRATSILGTNSEVQPDASLIVSPEWGGQTWVNKDDYLEGAPEYVAEVADSSESIDLHQKRDDYERAGVKEYLVLALRQGRVYWFIRRDSRFHDLQPGPDGIYRCETFPGLWLDAAALLRMDAKRVLEVLRQGLASPEHAAFVAQLASRTPTPPQP